MFVYTLLNKMVCHFGIQQVCLPVFKIIFFTKFPFVKGVELLSIGSLSNDDGNGNENVS